jgi:ribonuclease Z
MISSIKLYFFGTGGSWPTQFRNTASIGIRVGEEAILFDCGEGTQTRIMRSSLSIMKIKRIFISHFHGDHFLGLPGLIQTMSLYGREEPLEIYGPSGASSIISDLLSLGYYSLSFDISIKEMYDGTIVDFGDYTVQSYRASHPVPALSFAFKEKDSFKFDEEKIKEKNVPRRMLEKIRKLGEINIDGRTINIQELSSEMRKGRKISYSGDTRKDSHLVELFKDSTVLIHEATGEMSLADKVRAYGHSTGKDAAEQALLSNSKKLILVHFSPRYNDVNPILSEAKQVFENTEIANDLMELEVKLSEV